MVFQPGDLAPRAHLATPADVFGCHNFEGTLLACSVWKMPLNILQMPPASFAAQGSAPPHPMMSDNPAQSVNSAEAENPVGSRLVQRATYPREALRIGDAQNTDPCIPFLCLPGGVSHRAVTGGVVHMLSMSISSFSSFWPTVCS